MRRARLLIPAASAVCLLAFGQTAGQTAAGGQKTPQALASRFMNAAGDRQRLQLAIQQIQLQAQLLDRQLQEAQKAFSEADRSVQESLEALMKACGAVREKNDVNLQAVRRASEGEEVGCLEAFPPRSGQ